MESLQRTSMESSGARKCVRRQSAVWRARGMGSAGVFVCAGGLCGSPLHPTRVRWLCSLPPPNPPPTAPHKRIASRVCGGGGGEREGITLKAALSKSAPRAVRSCSHVQLHTHHCSVRSLDYTSSPLYAGSPRNADSGSGSGGVRRSYEMPPRSPLPPMPNGFMVRRRVVSPLGRKQNACQGTAVRACVCEWEGGGDGREGAGLAAAMGCRPAARCCPCPAAC